MVRESLATPAPKIKSSE